MEVVDQVVHQMQVKMVVQVVEERHHFHQEHIKKDVVIHLLLALHKEILEELVMVMEDQVVVQLQLEEPDKVQHLLNQLQVEQEHLI